MKRSTTLAVAAGFVLIGWGVEQEISKRSCPPGPPGPDGKPTQNPACVSRSGSGSSTHWYSGSSHSGGGWYWGGSSGSSGSSATPSHTTSRGGWGSTGHSMSAGS